MHQLHLYTRVWVNDTRCRNSIKTTEMRIAVHFNCWTNTCMWDDDGNGMTYEIAPPPSPTGEEH